MQKNIIDVSKLNKTYDNGFQALSDIDLSIEQGEIFALLGANGAGKTTLIGVICGLVNATSGTVRVGQYDHVKEYRKARSMVGLVPQELYLDPFQTVVETLQIARGLYGKKPDAKLLEETLRDLSLWEKKDNKVQELSGGMKRRVLIGKALMNEPEVLFLDEPTAGVDVELRHGMWELVSKLKAKGTTIILTTHYIEEAQDMADRIGVIIDGKITLVEQKEVLMQKFGSKNLKIYVSEKLTELPSWCDGKKLSLSDDGMAIIYTYKKSESTGITVLLNKLKENNIIMTDLSTVETSLEEIFVNLTHKKDSPSS